MALDEIYGEPRLAWGDGYEIRPIRTDANGDRPLDAWSDRYENRSDTTTAYKGYLPVYRYFPQHYRNLVGKMNDFLDVFKTELDACREYVPDRALDTLIVMFASLQWYGFELHQKLQPIKPDYTEFTQRNEAKK